MVLCEEEGGPEPLLGDMQPHFRGFVHFLKLMYLPEWVLSKHHAHGFIQIIIQGCTQVGSIVRDKAGERTALNMRALVLKVASQ